MVVLANSYPGPFQKPECKSQGTTAITHRCFPKVNIPTEDQRWGVKDKNAAPSNFKTLLGEISQTKKDKYVIPLI